MRVALPLQLPPRNQFRNPHPAVVFLQLTAKRKQFLEKRQHSAVPSHAHRKISRQNCRVLQGSLRKTLHFDVLTTARSSPTIRPSPRDSTPKATSPTPTIPGSADSTRTPTDSSVSTCPRAPISGLSHLRRSAASWTDSTTGHGNVLASRLQISYSQESTHLLHLRVESAKSLIANFDYRNNKSLKEHFRSII